ncbi:DUF7286 family protein [Haloplanus sp. C73]|uniref:DUF7286 family protein n=1 Tax=Haloplanus sp. C73 TaxID=3421641 RepID=UPI003EBF4A32
MTRLADDRRARVPFALVGALLLVGAATFGAALSTQGPARVDRDVDAAMDRTTAATTTALRSAIDEAAHEAASEPVTEPANTPYGRLLSDDTPFRDALRLRIYRSVEERLSTTQYRRGDVTAVASLPAATTPPELRTEMGRIEVRGVENGTALRVTVRNISITARESGRVVASEERTRTVTVSTPVLALHDRATTFETRLNRGPLDGPGLGRRLTARLYPVAWARGWGQFYGAPIANVVSNRHVETSTNGAVLEAQREMFGRSDPAGRRGMERAIAELGVRDFTAATPVDSAWADRVLVRPNPRRNDTGTLPGRRETEGPTENRTISVDVDPLASHAAAGLRAESLQSNRSLKEVLRAAYRVETELRTARRQTYDEPRPEPEEPGEQWSLTDVSETTTATVTPGTGSTPSVREDEHRLDGFVRNVALDRRVTWRWTHENDTTTTSAEWTERYRIGVTVVGTYAPNGTAPDRPTRPQFERGGPLNGPNLADVAGKAERVLVERRGGRDTVATRVASGELNETGRVVYGDRPADLRPWTNQNLSAFSERLDATNVSVEARGVATYAVNPPKRLATHLRERRSKLVDAPHRYRGAADRARVGARVALLNATIRRLERRSAAHNETRDRFEAVLDGVGVDSTARLRRILDKRETRAPSSRSTLPGSPPGGSVGIVPRGSPSYLTVASVGHDRATGVPPSRSYHPLSAKNVNLFAAPYGDAADTVAGSADESSGVRLRSGAQTLRASSADESSASRRRLRQSVAEGVDVIRSRSRRAIRDETSLGRREAEAAVAEGVSRWDRPANRAIAASNGSLAEAIAIAADERASGTEAGRADRLEARLDATITAARRSSATRVGEEQTADIRREVQRRITRRATERAGKRVGERMNETLEVTPAGLPVAPVPGHWYATVNVWTIEVKGAYARFTLRTRRGGPGERPGSEVQYVRDGSPVRFDVDGDGDAEHLGRDERVAFETGTVVTVAVPAYRSGVGDVDGNADERSGTWPRPECTSWSGACRDTE